MLLIGSRHRRDSCSEAYRFARSSRVPVDPKIDLDVSGLLSWGSSIAPPSTQPSLRRHPPGPSPRLRLGTARSRACSALAVPPGFSGFLRSEQIRRSARSTVRGFVAPRSRPWGSPSFGLPGSASQPNRRPEGRGPEGPGESSPVANTLRSVLLLGSRRPCRHRVSSFRTRSRSPAGVPSRRWSRARSRVATPRCAALDLRAFFHRGVRCVRATLPSRDRSMLPWALDRLVSDAAARIAPPSSRWTFRLAARTALASPDPNVGGRQGVSALSGSMRPTSGCPRRDDRSRSRWLRRLPKETPRPHSTTGLVVECQWIRPERRSTAPVRRPKAFGCRRHRDASPKRLVRDPALAPKSGGRWFELLLSVLPRLPAYMRRDRSPRTFTPGGVPVCAPLARTLAFEKGACCVEPATRVPKDSCDGRTGGTTRRWALGGSWLRHLQQAGAPAQGQTVVVFTGTAETRSEDEVSPPIRRSD